MKFILWSMVLEQVVFFLYVTRALHIGGEWFWWSALGFWILAGMVLAVFNVGRTFAQKISAGTSPARLSRPGPGVPAAKVS